MNPALSSPGSGVIFLNDLPYFVAKDDQGRPQWIEEMVPTQEGDPSAPRRRRLADWSSGMFDSRGWMAGAVELATNAVLPPGRILPGPDVTDITTLASAAITCFAEVTAPANRVLAGGGTYVIEINPATQAVAASNNIGGTVKSMQLVNQDVAIARGNGNDAYRRSSAGAYSAWASGLDADCFGLAVDGKLVRGRDTFWSHATADDFYSSSGSWGTEYGIGNAAYDILQVFNHSRWDLILKEDGLWKFDEDTVQFQNVLADLEVFRSTENRSFFRWYDQVFLCTLAGLYRYIAAGAARTVGVEEAQLNESELSNAYPTAGVAFGKWAYVAYYKPGTTTTYICMMRRAEDGDASLGSPYTFTSVIDSFSGQCKAMHVSSLPGSPTVYFAKGTSVSYFTLSRDGLPASYRDSGTVTVRMSPSDFGTPQTIKRFRKLEVSGRNAAADRAITFSAAMDGGATNQVGGAITSFTGGVANAFWTLDSNDSGRVMQLIASMTVNSTSTPPEVRDITICYEERPEYAPGAVVGLRLRDYAEEGGISDHRTAAQARADLIALIEAGPVTLKDPYGDSYTVGLSAVKGEIAYQRKGEVPQPDFQLQIRRLDYS